VPPRTLLVDAICQSPPLRRMSAPALAAIACVNTAPFLGTVASWDLFRFLRPQRARPGAHRGRPRCRTHHRDHEVREALAHRTGRLVKGHLLRQPAGSGNAACEPAAVIEERRHLLALQCEVSGHRHSSEHEGSQRPHVDLAAQFKCLVARWDFHPCSGGSGNLPLLTTTPVAAVASRFIHMPPATCTALGSAPTSPAPTWSQCSRRKRRGVYRH
jgi:hypothetical protein